MALMLNNLTYTQPSKRGRLYIFELSFILLRCKKSPHHNYAGNKTRYSVSTILTIERAERDKDSSEQQFKHIQSNHRVDCGERLVTKIFRAQIAPLKFNNDLESPTRHCRDFHWKFKSFNYSNWSAKTISRVNNTFGV